MTLYELRNLAKTLDKMIVATAVLAILPTFAQAQNVTFADFTQQDPTQRLFSKNGNLFSAIDTPVFFRFSIDNSYGMKNVFISGRLNLTANFIGPVTSGAGGNAVQALENFNATFTADQPGWNGSTNLLTITDSTGQFNIGGQAGGENSATDGGNTLNYSSSALDWSNTTSRNMSLSFTSATPPIDASLAVQNQMIPDFTASGGGQFASTAAPQSTAIPEAGTLSLLMLGIAAPIGCLMQRRRKRS